MRLRKELKDDYIRSTTRRNVIPKWKDVIQLLQPIDIRLLLVAIKVLGDMYVEFDDYETARNLYSFYKIVSFRLELLYIFHQYILLHINIVKNHKLSTF